MICAAAATLTTLTACGRCTDLGTRAGVYTVNVIGTSTGSPAIVETVQVVITVKL